MTSDMLAARLQSIGLDIAQYPNLARSFDYSSELVARGRTLLDAEIVDPKPDVDVVAFGSLARKEMTTQSDLDYLVLSYGFDQTPGTSRRTLTTVDNLRVYKIDPDHEFREPGSTGIFGKMISATDLVEVIGLENDTNVSHTRRILLLEESVSLYRPDLHTHLLTSMMTRYLEAKPLGQTRIPRFLLNDLSRYWRTLTVDYQAKTEKTTSAYSTRYLKLILSRKFTYASSVLPLFTHTLSLGSKNESHDDLLRHLVGCFSNPPVIRFIDACSELMVLGCEVEPHAATVLGAIESFNRLLGMKSWRDGLEDESASENPRDGARYLEGRELASDLQAGLEAIFFQEPLLPLSRRYLVF